MSDKGGKGIVNIFCRQVFRQWLPMESHFLKRSCTFVFSRNGHSVEFDSLVQPTDFVFIRELYRLKSHSLMREHVAWTSICQDILNCCKKVILNQSWRRTHISLSDRFISRREHCRQALRNFAVDSQSTRFCFQTKNVFFERHAWFLPSAFLDFRSRIAL